MSTQTMNDVIAEIEPLLVGPGSLGFTARFAWSDYRTDVDHVELGSYYQLRWQHQRAIEGSNVTDDTAAINIVVHHGLVTPDDEQAYTDDAEGGGYGMRDQQQALLDPQWWRDNVPSMKDILEGPELEQNVERVGNVISWGVLIIIVIR